MNLWKNGKKNQKEEINFIPYTMPENKTTETTNTSPEKAQEQQKTNTERTRANTNAAEKLQKTAEKPEKKDA